MSKDIRKNRKMFLRHLISSKVVRRVSSYTPDGDCCVCPKGQCVQLFANNLQHSTSWRSRFFGVIPIEIEKLLGLDSGQWNKMEAEFEDCINDHLRYDNPYYVAASWLQTLPGWPRVL